MLGGIGTVMTADRISFVLQEIDVKRFENIELTFEAGGSHKPIATVIWYFNLLRLKAEFNKDSIRFPIVLENQKYSLLSSEDYVSYFPMLTMCDQD